MHVRKLWYITLTKGKLLTQYCILFALLIACANKMKPYQNTLWYIIMFTCASGKSHPRSDSHYFFMTDEKRQYVPRFSFLMEELKVTNWQKKEWHCPLTLWHILSRKTSRLEGAHCHKPTPTLWFVQRIYSDAIRYITIIKAVSWKASLSLRKIWLNNWSKTDSACSFALLDWAWNEISNLMLTTETEMILSDLCQTALWWAWGSAEVWKHWRIYMLYFDWHRLMKAFNLPQLVYL